MLEYMRSENPFIGGVLDLMNPLTVRITGANVNQRIIENTERSGLKVESEIYLMTSIMRKLIISPNKSTD